MSNKEVDKDQKSKITRAKLNKGRVIISVYVESQTKHSHQRNDSTTKKIKPNPKPKNPQSTRAHDRRAQLLAYSHELGGTRTENVQRSQRNSRAKSKKWKWPSIVSVRIPEYSFLGMFQQKERRLGYERIVIEENSDVYRLSGPKRTDSRKAGSVNSNFWKKVICMLKELSCGLKCNSGT